MLAGAGGADRDDLPPAARQPGTGSQLRYLGLTLDTQSAASWLGALAVAVVGAALFEAVRRRFAGVWGRVQGEIEATMTFKEPDARHRSAARRRPARPVQGVP